MITFRKVSFSFGENTVFDRLDLTLPDTGCFALMGESGSGKTTLLRLLAGLLSPSGGSVTGTEGKRIAVLFQEDRLLPWRTALENVIAGSTTEAARSWLEKLEIPEVDKMPDTLSGGMQRRVALARALAFGGQMLLMDEPFKGLDGPLRARVAGQIRNAGFPFILFITHDPEEAELMGARILRTEEIRRHEYVLE